MTDKEITETEIENKISIERKPITKAKRDACAKARQGKKNKAITEKAKKEEPFFFNSNYFLATTVLGLGALGLYYSPKVLTKLTTGLKESLPKTTVEPVPELTPDITMEQFKKIIKENTPEPVVVEKIVEKIVEVPVTAPVAPPVSVPVTDSFHQRKMAEFFSD